VKCRRCRSPSRGHRRPRRGSASPVRRRRVVGSSPARAERVLYEERRVIRVESIRATGPRRAVPQWLGRGGLPNAPVMVSRSKQPKCQHSAPSLGALRISCQGGAAKGCRAPQRGGSSQWAPAAGRMTCGSAGWNQRSALAARGFRERSLAARQGPRERSNADHRALPSTAPRPSAALTRAPDRRRPVERHSPSPGIEEHTLRITREPVHERGRRRSQHQLGSSRLEQEQPLPSGPSCARSRAPARRSPAAYGARHPPPMMAGDLPSTRDRQGTRCSR
jgi:hypothetical protein